MAAPSASKPPITRMQTPATPPPAPTPPPTTLSAQHRHTYAGTASQNELYPASHQQYARRQTGSPLLLARRRQSTPPKQGAPQPHKLHVVHKSHPSRYTCDDDSSVILQTTPCPIDKRLQPPPGRSTVGTQTDITAHLAPKPYHRAVALPTYDPPRDPPAKDTTPSPGGPQANHPLPAARPPRRRGIIKQTPKLPSGCNTKKLLRAARATTPTTIPCEQSTGGTTCTKT